MSPELSSKIGKIAAVSITFHCRVKSVISTFIQILFTTRAKMHAKKGCTFKPRTRRKPDSSLRRRAVHTQKQKQQQQVRGKEIQK